MSLRPRLSLALVPAFAACLGLIGCGSDRAMVSKERTVQAAEAVAVKAPRRKLADTYLEFAWDVELQQPVHYTWIDPKLPNLLFAQLAGEEKRIVAIDNKTGETRWVSDVMPKLIDPRLPPGSSRSVVSAAGSARGISQRIDERVFVILEDTLFCLDVGSGHLIWRFHLPFAASTGPNGVGPDTDLRIFIGDYEGRMQVVTPNPMPRQAWQWNLHAIAFSAPIDRDDQVYVCDNEGTVSCFKLDRNQVWTFRASSHGAPAVRDSLLFVASEDNILYALNRLSGEELGHLNFRSPFTRAPFVFRGEPTRVYAWNDGDEYTPAGLCAVTAIPDAIPFTETAGRHPRTVVRMANAWTLPGATRMVGSTPEHLFCTAGDSNEVWAVDRVKGNVDWIWDASEQFRDKSGNLTTGVRLVPYHDATDRNRSVYTVGENGKIAAYRLFAWRPGDPSSIASAPAAAPAPASKPPTK